MKLYSKFLFVSCSFLFFHTITLAQVTSATNTLLPNRTLINFSGEELQNGIQLKGTLSANNTYDKIIIERGSTSTSFVQIAEMPVTNGGRSTLSFSYIDVNPLSGINYYRIRLMNTPQHIMEISNIMMIKKGGDEKVLEFDNTIIQANSPTLTLNATKSEDATLTVASLQGVTLFASKVKLSAGSNNFLLNNMSANHGYAIVVIETSSERKSAQIFIQ